MLENCSNFARNERPSRAHMKPRPNRSNRANSWIKIPRVYIATGLHKITTTNNIHDPHKVAQQSKISNAICNGNILPERELAAAQSRLQFTSIFLTLGKFSTRQSNGASRCTQTSVLELFCNGRYCWLSSAEKSLPIFGSSSARPHNWPFTIIDRGDFNEPNGERIWRFFTH